MFVSFTLTRENAYESFKDALIPPSERSTSPSRSSTVVEVLPAITPKSNCSFEFLLKNLSSISRLILVPSAILVFSSFVE